MHLESRSINEDPNENFDIDDEKPKVEFFSLFDASTFQDQAQSRGEQAAMKSGSILMSNEDELNNQFQSFILNQLRMKKKANKEVEGSLLFE